MKVDVKKVNARWKRWSIGIFLGLLWVGHVWSAGWFVTHHEVIQAKVLKRHDHLFPGRRHGWDCLEVAYVDVDGRTDERRIQWMATWAPETPTVELWRGTSGLIRLGPASYVEAFWFEAWMAYLAAFVAALIGVAMAYDRRKGIRRR